MVMSLAGFGPENGCAGEGQQQLQTTDTSSHERGCYIRTMTTSVHLKKVTGRETQGAWSQDELICGKPPVLLTATHSVTLF
jgi:hypothetical protein